MLILVLSDLHLLPEIRTSGTHLTGDCEYAIEQVKEILQKVKPAAAIIAGDVFDQPLVGNEELSLFRKLSEALDAGEVKHRLCIQGNHDPGKLAIPNVCFGFTDLNRNVVELDGIRIGGEKYFADAEELTQVIKDMSKDCDIFVTHASTAPFANFGAKLTPDSFLEGVFYIVGDTHLTKFYNRGNKRILSPGYLYPTRKNEFLGNPPGFCVLDVKADKSIEVYKLKLKRRFALDVTGGWNEETKAKVAAHASDKLAPIVYARKEDIPTVKQDVPVAEVALVPRVSQIIENVPVVLTGRGETVVDKIREAANTVLKGNPDRDEVVNLLVDLWNSNDPEGVLKEKLEVKNETDS